MTHVLGQVLDGVTAGLADDILARGQDGHLARVDPPLHLALGEEPSTAPADQLLGGLPGGLKPPPAEAFQEVVQLPLVHLTRAPQGHGTGFFHQVGLPALLQMAGLGDQRGDLCFAGLLPLHLSGDCTTAEGIRLRLIILLWR